ncbi:hypothetical protein V3C99_006771 [Haemonchus contortus]
MYPESKPVLYHMLHILMPVIAFLGNGAIVYVTIRSKVLRSPCNMLIALVSLSDMVLVCSEVTATVLHNIVQSETVSLSTCVFIQLPSVFAASTSPMFLLATAIDRRLCVMSFYSAMIVSYPKYYLAAQILPGCILGIVLDVAVLMNLKTEEQVVCDLITPMLGTLSGVYSKSVMIVCILILLCNVSFILFLRKQRISSETVRSVNRSVLVICMTVVLGYFSAMVIFSMREVLNLDVELLNWSVFASIFANAGYCVNFFVYYMISSEYRGIFDELLGIGHIKALFCRSKQIGDQQVATSSGGFLSKRVKATHGT